jgi:hypothetical protein
MMRNLPSRRSWPRQADGSGLAVTPTPAVLVVDDEPSIRSLLEITLRQHGFAVCLLRMAARLSSRIGSTAPRSPWSFLMCECRSCVGPRR